MKYVAPPGQPDPNAPFINGIPGVKKGSPVPAEAVEHPQREIVHCIEQSGLIPDGNDLTQLWQVLRLMIPEEISSVPLHNLLFETSSQFTVTASTVHRLYGCGAGGSGAGGITINTYNQGVNGGSGASGYVEEKTELFNQGDILTIVIGAGLPGGSYIFGIAPGQYGNNGQDGGDTIVLRNGVEIFRAKGGGKGLAGASHASAESSSLGSIQGSNPGQTYGTATGLLGPIVPCGGILLAGKSLGYGRGGAGGYCNSSTNPNANPQFPYLSGNGHPSADGVLILQW